MESDIMPQTLRKFARLLITGYPKEAKNTYPFDLNNIPRPFLARRVTIDIYSEFFVGGQLLLFGKYLTSYKKMLNALKSDKMFEYLDNTEKESLLWDFTCDLVAKHKEYRSKIPTICDKFLEKNLRSLEKYEAIFSIEGLRFTEDMQVEEIEIKQFSETDLLSSWKLPPIKARGLCKKTILCLTVDGTNQPLAFHRALQKCNELLKLIRTACVSDIDLHDDDCIFSLSNGFIRSKQGLHHYPLDEEKPIRVIAQGQFLAKLRLYGAISERQLGHDLALRFRRAIHWISHSIIAEDHDVKIVFLSTAIETLMARKDDKRKGETITLRLLSLGTYLCKGFGLPENVLRIYEARSDLVHGSRIGNVDYSDCSFFRFIAIATLDSLLDICINNKIKKHKKLLEFVMENGRIEDVKKWLRRRGTKAAAQILEACDAP